MSVFIMANLILDFSEEHIKEQVFQASLLQDEGELPEERSLQLCS